MAAILVVEDGDDTRELLILYLERCGHEVVPAANGSEALLAVHGRPGPIPLRLTAT